MHIIRKRLLEIAIASLRKMATHRVSKHSSQTWGDVLDMSLVEWLTEIIVMLNPKENCIICGDPSDWIGLDVAKSMLHLENGLGLELHMGKLEISEVHRGVEFLGSYILPWRTYVSNHSLQRMEKKIDDFDYSKPSHVERSVNSYLGIFKHTSSHNLTRRLMIREEILKIGTFNKDMTKFTRRRTMRAGR